jgi:hypothetical protein
MIGFASRKGCYCGSAALALCLAGVAGARAGQSVGSAYTDHDSGACTHRAGDRAVEDYGEWRCPGLGGLTVRVSAGDQRMTMSFGPRARDEPAARQTLQGFNNIDAARIEWRVVRLGGGRILPFAAILRWNTFLLDERDTPDKAVRGKVLVVLRLAPGSVCHVGYVDALANPNPYALARKIADERARSFHCDTDRPVILGDTGPGFSSSSEAEKDDR